MPEISDDLVRYLTARDAQRHDHVNRTLGALTDRERALVREAAVMGYVQGVQAGRAGDVAIPKDAVILWHVVAGCQAFNDLYPTISALTDASEETAPDA